VSREQEVVKLFAMTNQMLEHDLDRIERDYAVDLGRGYRSQTEASQSYYPQIEHKIRGEAAEMAPHYEVFYSLENSIRALIADTLQSAEGDEWWETAVPPEVKKNAARAQQRERDTGTTPRSDDLIDYTNFGELGEIIKTNWPVFGAIFSSVKAVERVMASLNTLRGPIAHCSKLGEDEVVRLRLAVGDWFRLME
jgi:hypothetical protein